MIEKIKIILVDNFATIINLCIFLIIGSLVVLISTATIEFRIVSLSKEIERLNYKANNALEWRIDIDTESNDNLIKNLRSQQIIALLDSDEYFEDREIALLVKTVEYGPMTFNLAYDDLLFNFSNYIDIDQINKKINRNNLIIDSFPAVRDNKDKDSIKDIASHNRQEFLFLSEVWHEIFQDSKEKIKILEASKNELVRFSSYIVIVVFFMQLILYSIFQLYEFYSERRKNEI